ncbi:hypothetical protein EW146_g4221 [Bondarzewia mesenterica]|uniref:Uncharacterized protein n=1 Tax=Bondarzewia mesenterica TaxID=1095465 RepID=A0A4S4LV55_9AGAM|nr:hypothetical protein EW146_g4221 [Bondarzewia mesenterica]
MVPTLRHSAPRTPTRGKPHSVNSPSTPRKVPHCTKCHRPRAGHPRKGCPYMTAPTAPASTSTAGPDLSQVMGSMYLNEPPGNEGASAEGSQHRAVDPNLASPSANSTEIVSRLVHLADADGLTDTDEEDNGHVIEQWREEVVRPSKAQRRKDNGRLMPGTFKTPRSSFIPTEASSSTTNTGHVAKSDLREIERLVAPSDSTGSTSRSLIRSMSMEERHSFLDGLAEISKAPPMSVYVVPAADLPVVQQSAAKLGFHTRVLTPQKGSGEADGLIVIGKDAMTVDDVFGRLSQGVQKSSGKWGFKTAAGGAMVGAVAAFTGLAFS